jgi:hypothetical protein
MGSSPSGMGKSEVKSLAKETLKLAVKAAGERK